MHIIVHHFWTTSGSLFRIRFFLQSMKWPLAIQCRFETNSSVASIIFLQFHCIFQFPTASTTFQSIMSGWSLRNSNGWPGPSPSLWSKSTKCRYSAVLFKCEFIIQMRAAAKHTLPLLPLLPTLLLPTLLTQPWHQGVFCPDHPNTNESFA